MAVHRWLNGVLVLLLCTLVAALLAPGVNGVLLQSRIDRTLAQAGVVSAVEARIITRSRGWFHSHLTLALAPAGYREQHFELAFAHGPAWAAPMQGRGAPFVLASMSVWQSGTWLGNARLHYDGGWQAQVQAKSLALVPHGGAAAPAAVEALRAQLGYEPGGRTLAIRAHARAVDASWTLAHEVALLGEYRVDASGWWFGETSLRASALSAPLPRFDVEGLELTAASTENGPHVAASLSLRAERLHLPEQLPGNLSMDVAARRIELAALRRWLRAGADHANAVPELLAGARLDVSPLTWRAPRGHVLLRADAKARVPPAAASIADVELTLELAVTEPFARAVFVQAASRTLGRSDLFGKLNEFDFADDERGALARASAAKQLSVLAAQGYLTLSGGVYNTRLSHRAGEWALNGRALAVR